MASVETKNVEQEDIILNGDEATAFAVKQCDVDVVAAYPITPQTIIVERLSEYKANGEADYEFIPVESEHSAMSTVMGASAAGARAFTATASQGLLLMNEVLWIVSSLRLPVVMAVVDRAVSAPINIHCDHTDIMSARDTSWIILHAENVQEVYDTMIQAFKIAEDERILLPAMVAFDGFLVSHTSERIRVIKDDKIVQDFLGGPRKIPKIELQGQKVDYSLNPRNPVPVTFGPLDLYDYYFEHKIPQAIAMEKAYEVIKEVHDEYARLTGRSYGNGLIHPYKIDDADVIAVVMGSTAGTMRYVVDEMREKGYKFGLIRIRSFRPFPYKDLAEALSKAKMVIVFDRAQDMGAQGGPLFVETRSALYDSSNKPIIINYVYGLGGRDAPPSLLRSAVERGYRILEGKEKPFRRIYLGVRGPEVRGD
ncbi:MAG: pyruvate ferredoxin oxidoreductase [Candidatus Njordarchaeia archaeon]